MITFPDDVGLCIVCGAPALRDQLTCGKPSCNAAALRDLQQEERERQADRIDGYDRDDLGLSPDY